MFLIVVEEVVVWKDENTEAYCELRKKWIIEPRHDQHRQQIMDYFAVKLYLKVLLSKRYSNLGERLIKTHSFKAHSFTPI